MSVDMVDIIIISFLGIRTKAHVTRLNNSEARLVYSSVQIGYRIMQKGLLSKCVNGILCVVHKDCLLLIYNRLTSENDAALSRRTLKTLRVRVSEIGYSLHKRTEDFGTFIQ